MASQSPSVAMQKGVAVSDATIANVEEYTMTAQVSTTPGTAGEGGGVGLDPSAGSADRSPL
jgi:hypothetical protein